MRVSASTWSPTASAVSTPSARLHPVAVVLDVGLPGMDGTEVCRAMRAESNWTPVLFVTARDDEVDRVLGLELGADDYVTKPFSPREVVARVRAVLRRRASRTPATRCAPCRTSALDPSTRRVTVDGDEVSLTATEFALLEHLMRSPGPGLPARAAARRGLGLQRRGRHAHRRRPRGAAARQAR